ncbi:MAG: hypothetical protein JKX92_15650 [Porticoccaceae bacterium]|nr:hypothetical protein [Porticoccaceae bacterium]
MDVFLPRLSDLVTQNELHRAVSKVLSKKFRIPLTSAPKLLKCSILEIADTQGVIEYHGLLAIQPDSAAKWFIRHSRNHKLHGKRLLSREYFVRILDRRSPGREHPDGDRRRPSLEIKRVDKRKHPAL